MSYRPVLALALAAAVAAQARGQAPPPDLVNYVSKPDTSFAWKLVKSDATDAGTVHEIDLTSQTWHEVVWTHKLQVFVPKGVTPRPTMVLWNQGGRPNATSGVLGLQLATKVGAPVAFLYGVPNQPLFGGKTEDALIAETFVRFLETKDSSWPLLFPMVKSLVRAMDTLQAFGKDTLKADVTHFVVTGASKRGWTSWLTAATGDKRVKAIAPLVIDTLNFPVQMENQIKGFGKPSEMVRDYTTRGLIPIPKTDEAARLWKMVDPWVYRGELTLPKMIINGANDPYWPLAALNSYWDDLKGDKYLLYVPNAGHDLRETDKDGTKELLPARAINTLSAFCKCQVFDKPMPAVDWKYSTEDDKAVIAAAVKTRVKGVRVWEAVSPTRDFRPARWTELQTEPDVRRLVAAVGRPATGFRAAFLEVEFDLDGLPFTLSSQMRVLEAKQ
ncbi:MAG: PhoPQ-activated pathogenicity-related family protein [Gemmataceae bacterium]|nr:PhoPQ-activated pathogenicity-related family protein [Gemmataceae bacterium]